MNLYIIIAGDGAGDYTIQRDKSNGYKEYYFDEEEAENAREVIFDEYGDDYPSVDSITIDDEVVTRYLKENPKFITRYLEVNPPAKRKITKYFWAYQTHNEDNSIIDFLSGDQFDSEEEAEQALFDRWEEYFDEPHSFKDIDEMWLFLNGEFIDGGYAHSFVEIDSITIEV